MNNSIPPPSLSSSLNSSSFMAKSTPPAEGDAKLLASGICDDTFVELFQTNSELTIRSFNATTYKAHLLDRYVGNVRKTAHGLAALAKKISTGRFLIKPDADEKNVLLEVGEDMYLLYPHTGANHERLHIRLLQHRIKSVQRPDDAAFFQQGRTTSAQWMPGESGRTLICAVGFGASFKVEPHVMATLVNPSQVEITKCAIRSVSTVGFVFEITLPRSASPEFAAGHGLTVAWMASSSPMTAVHPEDEKKQKKGPKKDKGDDSEGSDSSDSDADSSSDESGSSSDDSSSSSSDDGSGSSGSSSDDEEDSQVEPDTDS